MHAPGKKLRYLFDTKNYKMLVLHQLNIYFYNFYCCSMSSELPYLPNMGAFYASIYNPVALVDLLDELPELPKADVIETFDCCVCYRSISHSTHTYKCRCRKGLCKKCAINWFVKCEKDSCPACRQSMFFTQ